MEWLEQLYKELISLASENKEWCSQVFPQENADVIISSVFTGNICSFFSFYLYYRRFLFKQGC